MGASSGSSSGTATPTTGAPRRVSACPVYCHPDEVADAEGDGGAHYFDFSKLERRYARAVMPRFAEELGRRPREDRPGPSSEGDEVAGFKVVHLPGHAPGLIGLWRESDRAGAGERRASTRSIPQTGRYGRARVPHPAFNQDTEQARASMRKLADAGAGRGMAGPRRAGGRATSAASSSSAAMADLTQPTQYAVPTPMPGVGFEPTSPEGSGF